MNELDRWVYFDGPEPESLRPLLDAWRELPPATPADRERASQRFFEMLALSERSAESAGYAESEWSSQSDEIYEVAGDASDELSAPPTVVGARWVGQDGVTLRSPDAVVTARAEGALGDELHGERASLAREERVRVLLPRAQEPAAVPVASVPENLAGTSDAVEIPAEYRKGALPFKEASPDRPTAPKTAVLPVYRPKELARTLEAGDQSLHEALDALPFEVRKVGPPAVSYPALNVDQYASFCAKLSVWPEQVSALLVEFQVPHPGAREALDAHWRRELAVRPEVRAVFEGKLAEFTEYLRGVRARGKG